MKPPKQEHDTIINALEKHYTSTQLTAKGLAEILVISESHLNNICHTNFGKTPAKLILCFRMQKALELYTTIGEKNFTCKMVGYDNYRRYKSALREYCEEHKP